MLRFLYLLLTINFLVSMQVNAATRTIAVIGTGDMGNSLGQRFARLGYQVVYGSRNPTSAAVAALVALTPDNASAAGQEQAAKNSDVIVLALPWTAIKEVTKKIEQHAAGKIVVDMSSAWQQDASGYPELILKRSTAEFIQDWLPDAKVVKTFATAGSNLIDDPTAADGLISMPMASDHKEAKAWVGDLIAQLGFAPIDFGPLRMAKHIDSLQVVWLIPLFQRRAEGWEYYFRASPFPDEWNLDAWSRPTSDAEDLVELPSHLNK